jgi:large conductance mechanosensitive channel
VVKYGDLAGRIVDFLIVAAVVFVATKVLIRDSKPAATKSCPECLEIVPLDARRCRACASPLTAATRSA